MSPHDDYPPPKKHVTTGDVIWMVACICIGFLLVYVFYLLFTSLTGSTLYREILQR